MFYDILIIIIIQGLIGLPTLLGGNWNNAMNASAFYWNLNNNASNVNRNIGTQSFFVNKRCPIKPCLLAKHRNIKTCAGRGLPAFERSAIIQRPTGVLP
jgi:hypothetical protein